MQQTRTQASPDKSFRAAVRDEKPLQVAGAINAYTARLAEATGCAPCCPLSRRRCFRQLSSVFPISVSALEVLVDVRRITEASSLPLLVDINTGWGSAFNIARTIRSMSKAGAAAVHIEDQVGAKRCGRRPAKNWCPLEKWWIASKRRWTRVSILICDHGAHRRARQRRHRRRHRTRPGLRTSSSTAAPSTKRSRARPPRATPTSAIRPTSSSSRSWSGTRPIRPGDSVVAFNFRPDRMRKTPRRSPTRSSATSTVAGPGQSTGTRR